MATEQQEKEATYVRDHWDAQGKLVGYLITAHGAVLVGCLAALRDYPTTPLFTGIGLIIQLSAFGLLFGGLSFGWVTVLRSLKIKKARGTSSSETKPLFVTYIIFFFASVFLFIAELIAVASRLAHL